VSGPVCGADERLTDDTPLRPPDAALYAFAPPATARPPVFGRRHMAVAGHPLAATAAATILQRGGNAVDAGVAAGLCINVVQPDEATLGGVAPIMVYSAATRAVQTISGLGRWSRTVDVARLRAAAGGRMPLGVLRSVTPAAVDAWLTALDRFGTLTLAEVAAPALDLAQHGFPIDRYLALNLRAAAPLLARWPSSRAIFLPGGQPPDEGELLVQRDLAGTLGALVEAERACPGDRHEKLMAARDSFYRGPIAQRIARFVAAEGGFLTAADLAEYHVRVEPPVHVCYDGYDVYACGPWCQGPVLLETLNILSGYDPRALGHNSPAYLHLLIESLKAAFADRERYYGDPDVVPVPIDALLSPARAAAWRDRIDHDHAAPDMPDPPPLAGALDAPGALNIGVARDRGEPQPDTSYVCVVDGEGNAFSATPSDGVQYTPVVPGLGLVVSGRGDQSWLDPAHPSAVAPWKRPRLTPNPGLVLRDGALFLAYGTPGGDVQPQAMAQALLNILAFDMDPQAAVEAPRVATYSVPDSFDPHARFPGLVRAEGRLPEATVAALAARGHRVERWPDSIAASGSVCAILVDRAHGALRAGADPRRLAQAIGW